MLSACQQSVQSESTAKKESKNHMLDIHDVEARLSALQAVQIPKLASRSPDSLMGSKVSEVIALPFVKIRGPEAACAL